MQQIQIGNKFINKTSPTFIIAEMSANHGGDFNKAIAIIHKAKECGADAVKLQTYTADTITLDCNQDDFLLSDPGLWGGHKNFYSLYKEAYTPWEWHKALMEEAKRIGIELFSAPFDETAVDFLEELNVVAYKIASPEITDIPLIKKIGATGKPVIISTGVAELDDLFLAVKTLREQGCDEIIILKCTTAYPAPPEEVNLLTIPHMSEMFDCFVGISDHTLGIGVPVASVALGGKVIEKHFTLAHTNESVDAFFSLGPDAFTEMVGEVRRVEKALGSVTYSLTETAQKNINSRRSLYVAEDVKQGETLTLTNIKSVRPGFGLHPKYRDEIIGRIFAEDFKKGERLSWASII